MEISQTGFINMRTKIIAEIGVNHNGKIEIAKQLVEAAKNSGADIVKFQYFKAEELVSKNTITAAYQKTNTGISSQYELLKSLELSIEVLEKLKYFCDQLDIEFLCTSFSEEGLSQLCDMGMKKIKIPSGEIDNKPLLELASNLDREIFLSTGMSSIVEVKQALEIINNCSKKDVFIMHCTSLYPAPLDSLNINALLDIKNNLTKNIGYSDHSDGYLASCLALAHGVKVLEKHLTFDKNADGPDHSASLDAKGFKEYVKKVRITEIILGSSKKIPDEREKDIKNIVRKSWHSLVDLDIGTNLSKENIILKRPLGGISPLKSIYNCKVNKFIPANTHIKEEDID